MAQRASSGLEFDMSALGEKHQVVIFSGRISGTLFLSLAHQLRLYSEHTNTHIGVTQIADGFTQEAHKK